MSSERDKWADAVAKLNKLTKDNELTWNSAMSPLSNEVPEDSVGLIYIAKQGNNLLRLYKRRILADRFGYLTGHIAMLPLPRRQSDVELVERAVLEMVNDYGRILFTFPDVSGLKDLYESASYQVAGVKNFLEELLEVNKK